MKAPASIVAMLGCVVVLGAHRFVGTHAPAPHAPAPTDASSARAERTEAPTPTTARAPTASSTWSFGRGPHALGRGTSAEGHPVAPASFLVDAAGIVVLDQENARIVASDGRTIGLPSGRADDLARASDGSLAVLDRVGSKDVAVLDANGRLRGRLPLEGPGLDRARDVSRVVVSERSVYVERNGGGPLLRIGSIDGTAADARDEIAGIPTREGDALVSAGITSEDQGRAWVTLADRQGDHRWTRELVFAGELSAVGFTEGAGGAVWAVLLAGSDAETVNWAVCLDEETGVVRASLHLDVETPAWESFRDFAVRDDGSLVVATRSEEGVSFTTHSCAAEK